jgi:hypothetical protein
MLRPSSVRHLPVPSAHPRSSSYYPLFRSRNLAHVIKVGSVNYHTTAALLALL